MIVLEFHVWVSLVFVSPECHYGEVEFFAQFFAVFDDEVG